MCSPRWVVELGKHQHEPGLPQPVPTQRRRIASVPLSCRSGKVIYRIWGGRRWKGCARDTDDRHGVLRPAWQAAKSTGVHNRRQSDHRPGSDGGAQKYCPTTPANWRQPWPFRPLPATAQEAPNPLRGHYKDLLKPLFPQGNSARNGILPGPSRTTPACMCHGGNCNQPTHRTRD
jgi:hypothetical protein